MNLRRFLISLIAAELVLIGAGCSGGARVIPWRNLKPVVAPTPRLAPACSVRNLHRSVELQAGAGTAFGPIKLTNTGRRPCSLLGRPRLTVTGAVARGIHVSIGSMLAADWFSADWLRLQKAASLRALKTGESAEAFVQWISACGPGSSARVDGLTVTLRNGDRIVMRFPGSEPVCYGPHGRVDIAVSPFTPALRSQPRTIRLPLRASFSGQKFVKRKIVSPSLRTRRGQILRYEITLTNTSKRPFRFHGCPLYDEEFSGAQDKNGVSRQATFTYVLNCRPVGMIAAGVSVRFAMELPVANNAVPGTAVVGWGLAPPYEGEGLGGGSITVARIEVR